MPETNLYRYQWDVENLLGFEWFGSDANGENRQSMVKILIGICPKTAYMRLALFETACFFTHRFFPVKRRLISHPMLPMQGPSLLET